MSAHILHLARAAAIAGLLATALAASGCSGSHVTMPDTPASARPLPATGPHEVRTDLRVADSCTRYGAAFRGFYVQSYLLDRADCAGVAVQYAAALQGWSAVERLARRSGRAQGRTWVDGDRVLVAEVFDADGTPVLLVGRRVGDAGQREREPGRARCAGLPPGR